MMIIILILIIIPEEVADARAWHDLDDAAAAPDLSYGDLTISSPTLLLLHLMNDYADYRYSITRT